MQNVRRQMPPFKHEFYAIAIKIEGGGFTTTGSHDTQDLTTTVFFNSPYQIIEWDITPDWEGYYIIFTENFFRRYAGRQRITQQFPFLLSDFAVPIPTSIQDAGYVRKIFENLYHEHHRDQSFEQEIVFHYINILLLKTAQLYRRYFPDQRITTEQRDNDVNMVARFRTLLELSFYPDRKYTNASPHQVQFYAEQLNVHPNHLNALVKRITDQSASDLIQHHLLALAENKLKQTRMTIKEIAYGLHFSYPNHFSSFFKKKMGISPGGYRKANASRS